MDKNHIYNLTQRELDVLKLLRFSNKVIAEKLIISIAAVNSYKYNLYQKLNAHNALDATLIAAKDNLININELIEGIE